MSYAKLAGVGSFLPERTLTNYDLEKLVDTSHDWIVERSGIFVRHIAEPEDTVVSMGERASREALEEAGISADQLDLIIVATCTPEKIFPSSACSLQKTLKATQAAAFDISAACSGFVYALSIAEKFIKTETAKHVLVVGSEALSRVVDWTDRRTCVLFGDGAGAMVLSQSDEPGILASKLYADGEQEKVLSLSSGIQPTTEPEVEAAFIKMQGREVFRLAVERLSSAVKEIVEQADINIGDIDWIVPHQANSRIIKKIVKKLAIPDEKVVLTVDQHANTSSASIPLAFDAAKKAGRIKRGQTILFEAFGGGLTWGSVLLKY